MTKLKEKLHANKLRIQHEEFVNGLPRTMKELFTSCIHSPLHSSVKNLALSTWEDGVLTTTRGDIEGWGRTEYPTWESTREAFIKLNIPQDIVGWLTINHDRMHYEMSGELLTNNIANILEIVNTEGDGCNDLSWVGEYSDFGIVLEWNDSGQNDNEYEICHWGI
jgi:hypothetical protein